MYGKHVLYVYTLKIVSAVYKYDFFKRVGNLFSQLRIIWFKADETVFVAEIRVGISFEFCIIRGYLEKKLIFHKTVNSNKRYVILVSYLVESFFAYVVGKYGVGIRYPTVRWHIYDNSVIFVQSGRKSFDQIYKFRFFDITAIFRTNGYQFRVG